jgi:hypothetical protein
MILLARNIFMTENWHKTIFDSSEVHKNIDKLIIIMLFQLFKN